MCGDGTNDVGALKQAHVGVALLNGSQEDLTKIKPRCDGADQGEPSGP
jgi:P-type E1-E2 ATPase